MEFKGFLKKIVKIETERHILPLYGRLLQETEDFLTIEKRNGHIIVVSKDQVKSISATFRQPESE